MGPFKFVLKATAAFLVAVALLVPAVGAAQDKTGPMAPNPAHGGHSQSMMSMHHGAPQPSAAALPTEAGQDAFGTIQEIVRLLSADPATDWSKVNLEALRSHLIDMNEVTLNAQVSAKNIENGLQVAVTGAGRTMTAIRNMAPAHAAEINRSQLNGWSAKTELLENGVLLTVTSTDAKEVARIRGLGFIGIMASGSHHQVHHLAIAKGEFAHNH